MVKLHTESFTAASFYPVPSRLLVNARSAPSHRQLHKHTCANRIADDHGDKHWVCANNQRKWGHTCTQNVVLHVVEVSGGGTTSTRAVCRATTKTCTMI